MQSLFCFAPSPSKEFYIMATWTPPMLMVDNIADEKNPLEVYINDTNKNVVFNDGDEPIIIIAYEDFLDIVNFINKQKNG